MQEGGSVTDRTLEAEPAGVSATTKQAGEVRARWQWTEPTVWTERMLTALENGVKGGKWFSLIDKVYSEANLRSAFEKVQANHGAPGVDHQTIEMYEGHLEANLDKLAKTLKDGSYRPQAVRRVWIDKLGSPDQRPLRIPTVRDRVVQAALRNVLEPIFERDFAAHSYGFRPWRGAKDALRRVDALLKTGYSWVVDADIRSYFDTISHEVLLERIETKVTDGRVLDLVAAMLRQGVWESLRQWQPEAGTPQGAVVSPLLSNIYLDPLDHLMAKAGIEMVRYADDVVLFCRNQADATRALEDVQGWMTQVGLELHPEKTRLVDAMQPGGFDFLGYHFEQGRRWPRRKSLRKFRDSIRSKTKRTNGHSLGFIITDLNQTLRGWFGYFKHSERRTFPSLDSWTRMRLRSILRHRRGGRGRGRGRDHNRWPNAFFTAHGLFSLTGAHAAACQSSSEVNC